MFLNLLSFFFFFFSLRWFGGVPRLCKLDGQPRREGRRHQGSPTKKGSGGGKKRGERGEGSSQPTTEGRPPKQEGENETPDQEGGRPPNKGGGEGSGGAGERGHPSTTTGEGGRGGGGGEPNQDGRGDGPTKKGKGDRNQERGRETLQTKRQGGTASKKGGETAQPKRVRAAGRGGAPPTPNQQGKEDGLNTQGGKGERAKERGGEGRSPPTMGEGGNQEGRRHCPTKEGVGPDPLVMTLFVCPFVQKMVSPHDITTGVSMSDAMASLLKLCFPWRFDAHQQLQDCSIPAFIKVGEIVRVWPWMMSAGR